MTVDSTSRIALFSGGDKIAEQAVGNNTPSIPLTVAALRIGATEPNGYTPGTFLIEQVSGWAAPLNDAEAVLMSSDLNYTAPSGGGPKPVISIPAAMSIREGSTLQIPVTKEGVGACSVQIRTIGKTATTPLDYTGFLTVINFGANDTLINVSLPTISDAPGAAEESNETLNVELSLPVDCTLGTSLGVVTILELPRVSVPTTASVKEGSVLSVIVTKVGTGACSVTWRTSAVTASVALSDYLGQNPTVLSFGATETQKTVTVTTLTDAIVEGNETFDILLENPTDCRITTASCRVTILDANSPEVPVGTALTPASGYATASNFGIGYPIYKVTNLNDSGAGSLRDAVSAGNRCIIFEVAGRIKLASILIITQSNITVAGETAPAPGITITDDTFRITGSNVCVSHICFQKGYDANNLGDSDCMKLPQGAGTVGPNGVVVTTNVLLSHCAFYWAMDETVEMWPWISRSINNVSFHDCIFAEPLYRPSDYDSTLKNHTKMYTPYNQNSHNYGILIGYGVKKIDIQYCLFQDLDRRGPFIDHSTEVVLANLIANNCRTGATIEQNPYMVLNPATGVNESKPHPADHYYKVTCKGYLCISGPDTGTGTYGGFRFHSYLLPQPGDKTKFSAVYVSGLYGWKGGPTTSTYQTPKSVVTYGSSATGMDGVAGKPYWLDGTTKKAVEVTTPPIDTPTATVGLTDQEIYDRAVLNVGPRPKEIRALIAKTTGAVGNKDVARTVQRLKDKTGRWTNHEDETVIGGFYNPAKVDRAFTATAKFPDNSLIGVPPTGLATPTATSRSDMRAWLRKHLDQIQND
jgi:hypothetical protein